MNKWQMRKWAKDDDYYEWFIIPTVLYFLVVAIALIIAFTQLAWSWPAFRAFLGIGIVVAAPWTFVWKRVSVEPPVPPCPDAGGKGGYR